MKPLSKMLSLCYTPMKIEPVWKSYFETYDDGIVSVNYFDFKSMPDTFITGTSLNLTTSGPTVKYFI